MSTDKADPSTKDAAISSADDLVKTNKGDVELTEEELKRVTGGGKSISHDKLPPETVFVDLVGT
jgi:bacteriocin-like protein